MKQRNLELDFGSFVLEAELFDTGIAEKFAANLPYRVSLMPWGDELFGTVAIDLGEENPVTAIPAGGLAYTNKGFYVCIFFGQRPAWAVEHIGRICGNEWKKLRGKTNCNSVDIRLSPSCGK